MDHQEGYFARNPETNFGQKSILDLLQNDSSGSDFDSDGSSSSDEPWEDYSLTSHKMSRSLAEIVATHIPFTIAAFMRQKKRSHGGSSFGRRFIYRDRKSRHDLIIGDYFKGEESRYTSEQFRRRFRMNVDLFNRILNALGNYDNYFTQKTDAVGKSGLSPLQKMIAALRMLAYGCPADLLDEYLQIGQTTVLESLKHFCEAIIGIFEEQYLRRPNEADITRLLKEGEERGFPGMLGSLDCMHWHWKNCPTAWHGSHTNGFKRVPTLILEAVASKDLWIWHAFFGMAGTNNDITVLDRSPLFDDLLHEIAPPCTYIIQGHRYNMGYYLSDGIYPQYATLVQSISHPSNDKEILFAQKHEFVRKDVERAFGVLQSRWNIVKGPARMWKAKELGNIMKTCIILHNMIIENEQHKGIDPERWEPPANEKVMQVNLEHDYAYLVTRMINRFKQIRDKVEHNKLKTGLINHLWDLRGNRSL